MPEEHRAESAAPIVQGDGDLRVKVTALLAEIALAPEHEVNAAWEPGFKPGSVIGRFELLRELGRGGFGVVFEARDRELGRLVAFKAVRPGTRARSAKRVEWLAREAEAAAQLNHENIVALHDVGRAEGGPYLIFELLEGETLQQRLDRGPLELGPALDVALPVARALAWAHAGGVIHRDLKPSNVFLTSRGGVKVLDFGLARVFGRATSESGGTPAYMAPEQWRGGREDERTDVFAFGVLLYETLTGRVPFQVLDGRSSVMSAVNVVAPSLDGIPLGLRPIVRSAISADPAERPQTIEAVIEVLERVAARHRPSWQKKLVPLLWLAGVAMIAAFAFVAWRFRTSGMAADDRGRTTVAVADFANDTGDPDLDSLAGMLATSLEQSRRLEVVTRTRLIDAARQLGLDGARLDQGAVREAAKSSRAKALLLPSVHRNGDLYTVDLDGIDPVSQRRLFKLREQASAKDRLPAMVDRLSQRVRERMSEDPNDILASRADVARVTTPSLEAYAHYVKAEQLRNVPDWPGALQELGAALDVDPGFALAYWLRSYIGEFTGESMESRRADAQRALSLADRLPRKERLLVEGWTAQAAGDDARAAATFAQAVDAFPNDKDVLFMAGDVLHHAGRTAAAADLFLRALQLDPRWAPGAYHVIEDLALLGRKDELLEVARRAVEVSPDPASYALLAYAHRFRDEGDESIAASQRAVDLGGGAAALKQLADAYLWAERLDEADATAKRMLEPSVSAVWRLEAYHERVKVLAMRGRHRDAMHVLDTIPPAAQAASVTHHHEFITDVVALMRDDPARLLLAARGRRSGWVPAELAYSGDLASAAKAARHLDDEVWRELYDAVAAWRRGELEDAVARLQRVTARRSPAEGLAQLYLGELLGELGRDSDALQAIAAFQGRPEMNTVRAFGYPRSLLYAARSQERLGMRTQALENVNHLLALWQNADPDLPELSEARALGARLVARGPRR